MKRILKVTALLVLAFVVLLVAAFAPVFLGRRSVSQGAEINGIQIVRDGFVTVAVIPVGDREVALIDAGNDASGTPILDALSKQGLGADAVVAILITHGHRDHIAAIPVFPKAEVMALAQDVALVEGRARARGPLPRLMPARPTGANVRRALDDGETVTLGDVRIRVFGVPGHTAGSAAYLVNGVLFLGDAADAGRDGTLKGAPWIFSDNQAEDRASLVRLARRLSQEEAAVEVIAFAHSGTLAEGLAPLTTFAQSNQ
jgi:glyoxylase-like metal-dependent hydrolase (beta-lactamase superfamily II)